MNHSSCNGKIKSIHKVKLEAQFIRCFIETYLRWKCLTKVITLVIAKVIRTVGVFQRKVFSVFYREELYQ